MPTASSRQRALMVLKLEELEDAGIDPPTPPADMPHWDEAAIISWFDAIAQQGNGRDRTPLTTSEAGSSVSGNSHATHACTCTQHECNTPSLACTLEDVGHMVHNRKAYDLQTSATELQQLQRWVPKLHCDALRCCRVLVLCFHAAGCAEDMYSGVGSGSRKTANPLQDWLAANCGVLLAFQLPGRAERLREPPVPSLQALALQLADLLLPLLASGVPYVVCDVQSLALQVVGHSMGAWAAYEVLRAVEGAGGPAALHAFLSAMPAPDIAVEDRPWRRQAQLQEAAFQDECREWDVNPIVFSEAMWPVYHGLMRNDFRLFDEYSWQHHDKPPIPVAAGATLFYGQTDRRVTRDMVSKWTKHLAGPHEMVTVQGHHLWPLQAEQRVQWLRDIVDRLQASLRH